MRSFSLRVPRTILTELQMQRSFSHYQVTGFITHQRTCIQDKAPGKNNQTLLCYIQTFHYHHLPNLRTKSWVLPLSSRRGPQFLSPRTHAWCQKIQTSKTYDPKGKTNKQKDSIQCTRLKPNVSPISAGQHRIQITYSEQQVKENKEQKSRRLELTGQKQMVANKQTENTRQNLANDRSVWLTPFLLTYRFPETDGFETTFVTDMSLMERTLK